MSKEQKLTVEPNEPFVWSKNLKLSPVSGDVTVLLPGGLVKAHEEIRSIIEISDDEAEIGFRESEVPDEPFGCIVLKVTRGVKVCLKRSTQAIVVPKIAGVVVFQVEECDCG